MHLVQRLLSLRENAGALAGDAGWRIGGAGFRWCAAPQLRTWCKGSRKRLFLRFLAPSHLNPKPPIATDWVFDVLDVVLHLPLSSRGTTFPGPVTPSASWAWCLTPREPLFLRPGAPRLRTNQRFPAGGRGASPPAMMCYPSIGQ